MRNPKSDLHIPDSGKRGVVRTRADGVGGGCAMERVIIGQPAPRASPTRLSPRRDQDMTASLTQDSYKLTRRKHRPENKESPPILQVKGGNEESDEEPAVSKLNAH